MHSAVCSQMTNVNNYKWLNSTIWPIDGTLTGTTTLGQSRPESDGYEEVLYIPQTLRLEPHH